MKPVIARPDTNTDVLAAIEAVDNLPSTSPDDYAKQFAREYKLLESREARANAVKTVVGFLTGHESLDFGKDHVRIATAPDDEYEVEECAEVLARYTPLSVESEVTETNREPLKTVTIHL